MALTYFGLLPPEILSNCIFPRLDDLSRVILRYTYRGHELPLIPSLYRDAAQNDSLSLVQFLIDNKVPFCRDKESYLMYHNTASVRSIEVAGVLVASFPAVFKKYYETLHFNVNDEVRDEFLRNRHLFAPYVSHVMDIEAYLKRITNSSSTDPIVRVIALAQPEYIASYGNYFAITAIRNNDDEWVRHLISNGYKFTERYLDEALIANGTNVIHIIREQLGMTEDLFNKLCLEYKCYTHITNIKPLINDSDKLTIFTEAAAQGATNIVEELAPHIDLTDPTILNNDYPPSSLKWFYDHNVAVNPYSVIRYETEELTVDLFSKIIQHYDLDTEQWHSIIYAQRADLLFVLVEAGRTIASQIRYNTFNEQVFDLLLRAGAKEFIFDFSPSNYFDYLQWAHNRILPVDKISVVGYSMSQSIWLIEHGHYYRNKTFAIPLEAPIDEIIKFVMWMKHHTYVVTETILVRGFEGNYRIK